VPVAHHGPSLRGKYRTRCVPTTGESEPDPFAQDGQLMRGESGGIINSSASTSMLLREQEVKPMPAPPNAGEPCFFKKSTQSSSVGGALGPTTFTAGNGWLNMPRNAGEG
jgi:hypothetical protein